MNEPHTTGINIDGDLVNADFPRLSTGLQHIYNAVENILNDNIKCLYLIEYIYAY